MSTYIPVSPDTERRLSFTARLPEDLYRYLVREARDHDRTLNAEITRRLRASVEEEQR